MGSNVLIYIQSFIKFGSAIQELMEGGAEAARGSHEPIFISSK
jgi:hypothetical protein